MLNYVQTQELNFYTSLPFKPYCSWGKGEQSCIRSKSRAVNYPLIQVNPPHLINYLIFDIDKPDGYLRYIYAGLAVPTWIAKNRKNGHVHIGYWLKAGVCKTENARQKPLIYLAAIEYSYAKALGADTSYTGLLTKNPLSPDWEVYFLNPRSFSLAELADYVDLEKKPPIKKEVSGLGRNCMLFEIVRIWSYKAIREHLSGDYDNWYTAVLERCESENSDFIPSLPYSEIKAIAKSIAKWVWRNHNSSKFHAWFSKKQIARAKIGVEKGNTSKGGKARSAQYSDLRQEALKLHIMGINNTQIASQLKVSRRTIINWLKQVKIT